MYLWIGIHAHRYVHLRCTGYITKTVATVLFATWNPYTRASFFSKDKENGKVIRSSIKSQVIFTWRFEVCDHLTKASSMQQEDAKMSKLEYYVTEGFHSTSHNISNHIKITSPWFRSIQSSNYSGIYALHFFQKYWRWGPSSHLIHKLSIATTAFLAQENLT
jgi:hypothetical protein